MVTVTAHSAVKEAEQKVRDAIMRESIARSASASAAKAQVTAEAEVLVLRADASRLRDELRSAENLAQRAVSERDAYVSAAVRDLRDENESLRAAHESVSREIDDLNAVLRARSQDITQLGQVIIQVFQGEVDPRDLGDMAAGIANVLGTQKPQNAADTTHVGTSYDAGRRDNGRRMDKQSVHTADALREPSPPPARRSAEHEKQNYHGSHGSSTSAYVKPNQPTAPTGDSDESEDASVPIDSAFFGVDADEISWDAPLSVRKHRPRPFGMPTLALENLAPPPDDPDAAMLEFAYEQQYGKEAAKRMVEEAKRTEIGRDEEGR
ncbi:hypothetical protein N9L76_00070 [bacterium]|nr:hypothetical protein [bacterium]